MVHKQVWSIKNYRYVGDVSVWNPSLSEFVLNKICELVDGGLNLSGGFKECYLKSVCNNLKDFTGVTVKCTTIWGSGKGSGRRCASLRIFQGWHLIALAVRSWRARRSSSITSWWDLHITSLFNMFKLLWFTQLTKCLLIVRNSRRTTSWWTSSSSTTARWSSSLIV
jgi:hypothetical protein